MSKAIPKKTIVDAAINGIISAQKDYYVWADFWLWQAPEYFLTVKIAESLAELEGRKYITLENSVKGALSDASAVGAGRKHSKLRHTGRYDILLWWGMGTPRAPIEVKNQVTRYETISEDIERIKNTLRQKSGDNDFEFGLMAFYSSTSQAKTLKTKLEDIETETLQALGKSFDMTFSASCFNIDSKSVEFEELENHEGAAWAACCFAIKYID